MERGELLFTYRLGKPGLGYGRKQYNDKISGMTILGEVLSTERETVRLKLDIDEGWNPGGPYAYTWRPETGNMMYCMPQAGTRVSLYFPNYDEQAAMAVNCVRTNGASCARMSDPSRRSFVTEHGKEMNLYPQEMSLLGGANGTVKLEDETGIAISTDKKITVVAQGKVFISAKTATGAAPIGEIVMAKRNVLADETESSLVQSNQYDLLSVDYTHMEGWNQQTFEAYDDAPQEGSFDWGGLIGNVLAGLVVVGAVALTLATFGAAAPVIIGAVAVGTTAVIGQAMSDYASGTVSSVGTYMMTGFMGAVAGAVSGGVGSLIEGAIPAGATALTKMGIVGGSGVVETLIENTIMGQETTLGDLAFAFVASAGLFGIGDNIIPILNQVKRGGQAIGSMLDRAGRSIDNALTSVTRSVDNALNSVDNVLSSAARQAGNTLDSISKELYETLDDMFRKLEDVFPPPNRPRYAYAMAGGPADFVDWADDTLNIHRIDAEVPRTVDIDVPPRGAGEAQRVSETVKNLISESDAAEKWGILNDGTNQGAKHFSDYWEKYPDRIPSLEQRLGVQEGTFNNTLDGFNNFTMQAERVISEATSAGNVRAVNGKMIYYVEGVVNPKKGIIVIVCDGKIQSMMPSNLKSFNKME